MNALLDAYVLGDGGHWGAHCSPRYAPAGHAALRHAGQSRRDGAAPESV